MTSIVTRGVSELILGVSTIIAGGAQHAHAQLPGSDQTSISSSVDSSSPVNEKSNWDQYDVSYFKSKGIYEQAKEFPSQRFSSLNVEVLIENGYSAKDVSSLPQFSCYELTNFSELGIEVDELIKYPIGIKSYDVKNLHEAGISGTKATDLKYLELLEIMDNNYLTAIRYCQSNIGYDTLQQYGSLLSTEEKSTPQRFDFNALLNIINEFNSPRSIEIFGLNNAYKISLTGIAGKIDFDHLLSLAETCFVDLKSDSPDVASLSKISVHMDLDTLNALGFKRAIEVVDYYAFQPKWKHALLTKFFADNFPGNVPVNQQTVSLLVEGIGVSEYEARLRSYGYDVMEVWQNRTFHTRCLLNRMPSRIYNEQINPIWQVVDSLSKEESVSLSEASIAKNRAHLVIRSIINEHCRKILVEELGADFAILENVFQIRNFDQVSPDTCKELLRIFKDPDYRRESGVVVYFQLSYYNDRELISSSIPFLAKDNRVLVFQIGSKDEFITAIESAKCISAQLNLGSEAVASEFAFEHLIVHGLTENGEMCLGRNITCGSGDSDVIGAFAGLAKEVAFLEGVLKSGTGSVINAISKLEGGPERITALNGQSTFPITTIQDGHIFVISRASSENHAKYEIYLSK